jgi:hypothetical protein
MLRVSLALLLLLVAAPVAPAGPPEAASGGMVLDQAADGLRRYQRETDPTRRARWLRRLASTHDPRVALALAQALTDGSAEVRSAGAAGLLGHFAELVTEPSPLLDDEQEGRRWWKRHEADLRRRAQQLP